MKEAKIQYEDGLIHYLFFKKHNVKQSEDSKKEGKTIFLSNIPVGIDEAALQKIFEAYGKINQITLDQFHAIK